MIIDVAALLTHATSVRHGTNREIRLNHAPERLPALIDLRNNATRVADACQVLLALKAKL